MICLLDLPHSSTRIYGLDILRATAVLTVMLGHTNLFYETKKWFPYYDWLVFDGVSVFFVLSGFLIGGILIKAFEGAPATGATLFNFWIKRWTRTIPPYVLVLTPILLLSWSHGNAETTWMRVAKFLFFLQNFSSPHPQFFREAWSLSVEEWFYIIVPSSIFVLIRFAYFPPKKAILTVAITVLILVTIYRWYVFTDMPPQNFTEWDLRYRKIVVMRLDSLMYGVIGAYCAHYFKERWVSSKNYCLFFGVLFFGIYKFTENAAYTSLFQCVFSFCITPIATLLCMPYMSECKKGKGILHRILTHISLISYSLYLLHLTIVQEHIVGPLSRILSLPPLVSYSLFWIISLALATIMYKYFEIPAMNGLRKLYPSNRSLSPVEIA